MPRYSNKENGMHYKVQTKPTAVSLVVSVSYKGICIHTMNSQECAHTCQCKVLEVGYIYVSFCEMAKVCTNTTKKIVICQ